MYSDHAPILSITQPVTVKTKKYSKFENWWLLEEDFHDATMKKLMKNPIMSDGIMAQGYLAMPVAGPRNPRSVPPWAMLGGHGVLREDPGNLGVQVREDIAMEDSPSTDVAN